MNTSDFYDQYKWGEILIVEPFLGRIKWRYTVLKLSDWDFRV